MPMFPAVSSDDSASSSSQSSARSGPRARCMARLAGTRVEVYVRDNATITGILSVRGNCALYPWRDHPLTAEELASAVKYTRGSLVPEDGWRTVVGRRARKKDEGRFDKIGKFATDNTMLWLRAVQRRAGGSAALSSPIYALAAISWRDIQGFAGSLQSESSRKARFQTDAQISGQGARRERTLERWTDDHSDTGGDEWPSLSLAEDEKRPWNQFEENSRMFGVKTTYDEALYTTHLNVTEIPEEVQRRAAELASEMNGGRYKDEDDDEVDDEKRFSAVAGSGAYAVRKRAAAVAKPPPPPASGRLAPGATAAFRKREDPLHRKELLAKAAVMRLPKDNINALNLEPIKPGKRLMPIRPGSWKTDKLPNRQKTLEEFSQSAQVIQEKLEKKGWIAPSSSTGSSPVRDDKAAPPAAPRPAEGQSAATTGSLAGPSLAASAAPPASAAPEAPPPSPAARRDESFQFNPNANSFTPKGEPCEKAPPGPAAAPLGADPLSATLAEISAALVSNTSSSYALASWNPRFQLSYIDCLAASPAAYPPYAYEYPPPPPVVMIKESAAAPAYYYTPY